jgi:tetratricopeptide (TPR) repeat protein
VDVLQSADPKEGSEDLCYAAVLHRSADANDICTFVIEDLSGGLDTLDATREKILAAAYNNRALIRMRSGDQDGAGTDLATALLLAPEDAALYLNRGNLRLRQGQFGAALVDYDIAIDLTGEQLSAVYHNRVFAHRALGQIVQAEAAFLRAMGHEVWFTPADPESTDEPPSDPRQ